MDASEPTFVTGNVSSEAADCAKFPNRAQSARPCHEAQIEWLGKLHGPHGTIVQTPYGARQLMNHSSRPTEDDSNALICSTGLFPIVFKDTIVRDKA
jgi:hypothetical protein